MVLRLPICALVAVLGLAAAAELPFAHVAELREKRLVSRQIMTRGTILDVFNDDLTPNYTFFLFDDGGTRFYASMKTSRHPAFDPYTLIGATVTVRGSFHLSFVDRDRKYIGWELSIATPADITVENPDETNPFIAPEISATEAVDPGGIQRLGRRRASGLVIALRRRGNAYIRTRDGSVMRLELRDPDTPRVGEFIEAVGWTETDIYHLNLSRAIWRRTAPWSVTNAPPAEVTASRLLNDENGRRDVKIAFHGRTVRIRGTVRTLPDPQVGDGNAYLESGNILFAADCSQAPDALSGLVPGCDVEVTGVCLLEIDNWQPHSTFPGVRGFAVAVNAPGDLRILSRPSWWTSGRLLAVIAGLFALIVLLAVWTVFLLRLIERRRRQLVDERIARAESDLRTEERTRLAVELHDSISQNLTGVSMQIDAAGRLAETDGRQTRRHLEVASRAIDSCRAELRNCIWDLRNDNGGHGDLAETLRTALAPHVGGADVRIDLALPRDRLTEQTVHTLVRIVRELATNAVRHGHARTICITGSSDGPVLRLTVEDDGCGFDPETRAGVDEGHFGLQGVAERIRACHGRLEIKSSKDKGTKVCVELMC